MVLKLYGWFASTPSLFVALILHEKKIPFEWIELDLMKWEHKAPKHLTKNPFGQVPVIDDDGFILYESRAIVRYLEEKYPNQGTQLYPNDLQKRALVDQAVWTEAFHFNDPGVIILRRKRFLSDTDSKRVAKLRKTLLQKLDLYEGILSKQKYLVGDEMTLADLAHIPVSSRLLGELNLNIGEGRPNVTRWLNELFDRESWHKVRNFSRDFQNPARL